MKCVEVCVIIICNWSSNMYCAIVIYDIYCDICINKTFSNQR